MRFSFRAVAMVLALLLLLIGLVWLLAPDAMLSGWGVASTPSAALLGRRSAALYVGFAAMFYFARDAEPSAARSALVKGMVLACLMLAALGVLELRAGNVTVGILVPVVLEVTMSLVLLFTARRAD
nr:hypothetical protein [uncultured Duganella sp.]